MTFDDFLVGAIPLAFMLAGVVCARVLRYRLDRAGEDDELPEASKLVARPVERTTAVSVPRPQRPKMTARERAMLHRRQRRAS